MSLIIQWFRQDLRISDNPALFAAANKGEILPIYILDNENAGKYKIGSASRIWLHHSLEKLNESLEYKLRIFTGDAKEVIAQLLQKHNISAVYWNRCYEPWRIKRDQAIKEMLKRLGVEAHSFNGSLLIEPWELLKEDDSFYKVFTPFYKKAYLKGFLTGNPISKPYKLMISNQRIECLDLDSLKLLPTSTWSEGVISHWQIGEEAAYKKLEYFLQNGINDYKEGRDFPDKQNVSYLSPHLHFGELSPRQIVYNIHNKVSNRNLEHFLREITWREFSYYLLYHFPELPDKNFQSKFDYFPWRDQTTLLSAWQKGETGYPIVDAGMRELWQTGYMHNRVRMIVGSFLVKNLLLPWHHGRDWFWDCLLDADLANNSASWQWVAGSGVDAAPYFRIFNSTLQGKKFDPEGSYIFRFIPELNKLPKQFLFNIWEAPSSVLKKAGITLGQNYPNPIIDLKYSREKALQAYNSIK
ncbi:cryptochrome/photolyase family protein [Candidatus Trichorickettsia mobilis]|uniref:cryptochrome/photolyase family protein n=1 Tax=Candidatus Trichorickettsia mobilis TaxID=1346319 RepID=UPI0029304D8B|nr:deoxyribodipyrimidine photo-lyase [Candidatus Trichorickettsia mobilis]